MRINRQVVVSMCAGWGNQLFQAAHGYALARRLGADLRFSKALIQLDPNNRYALGPYERALGATGWDGRVFVDRRLRLQLACQRLARWHLFPRSRDYVALETSFQWQKIEAGEDQDIHLIGFWQSERYFADAAAEVRKALTPEPHASPEVASLVERLRTSPSVSVHVRRGDYVGLAVNRGRYVCLDREYYRAAAARVREIEPRAQFHVFSDAPADAAELFTGWDGFEVHPGRSQEEDHLLMSSCRHHIIANSTFSWWAAWLGSGIGRVTIAPSRWFQAGIPESRQTQDLLPADWLRC